MSQIVLDDDLKAKLNGLTQTVQVRDEIGRVVGQFVPQQLYIWMTRVRSAPVRTSRRRSSSSWARVDNRRMELGRRNNQRDGVVYARDGSALVVDHDRASAPDEK